MPWWKSRRQALKEAAVPAPAASAAVPAPAASAAVAAPAASAAADPLPATLPDGVSSQSV